MRASTKAFVSRGKWDTNPTFRHALYGSERSDDTYEPVPLTSVYFVLDHQAAQIKIGWTTDVDRRLKQLERQRGRKLDLLGSLRGGYNLERAMHGRFRQHRVEANEWYSSEIIADVASLLR